MRTITLELDEDDWNAIQKEIAIRQSRRDKDGPLLPDGESNMVGAMLAEVVRDLEEYRAAWEGERLDG